MRSRLLLCSVACFAVATSKVALSQQPLPATQIAAVVQNNRAYPNAREGTHSRVFQAVRIAGRDWPGGPQVVQAEDLGLFLEESAGGLVVIGVADRGAIARLGLMTGDRIVGVNDALVTTEAQLVRLLLAGSARNVDLVVERNGMQLAFSARPQEFRQAIASRNLLREAGIAVKETSSGELVVESVAPDSRAFQWGLRAGDAIGSVSGQNVGSAVELGQALQNLTAPAALQISRSGSARELSVSPVIPLPVGIVGTVAPGVLQPATRRTATTGAATTVAANQPAPDISTSGQTSIPPAASSTSTDPTQLNTAVATANPSGPDVSNSGQTSLPPASDAATAVAGTQPPAIAATATQAAAPQTTATGAVTERPPSTAIVGGLPAGSGTATTGAPAFRTAQRVSPGRPTVGRPNINMGTSRVPSSAANAITRPSRPGQAIGPSVPMVLPPVRPAVAPNPTVLPPAPATGTATPTGANAAAPGTAAGTGTAGGTSGSGTATGGTR